MKTHTYITQPSVRFKYDMMLVFEGSMPGNERVWSTFESVNALYAGSLAAVDVQASEQDLNMDGKMDIIDVKAVAKGLGDVHGVKAMMAFVRFHLRTGEHHLHHDELPIRRFHILRLV